MYRILVVDDHRTNIKILNDILRKKYRVSVAKSGLEALEVVNKEPPDLILLDIMMPGMDGYQVCEQLKKSPKTSNILVIFVSAKSEIEDETKGLTLGAVDYITKPISPPIVLARIKNHLELKQIRNNLEALVNKRTDQLQQKVRELEARDRLVRLQMQSPEFEEACQEILKEIGEVINVTLLCIYLPDGSVSTYCPTDSFDTSVLFSDVAKLLFEKAKTEKKLQSTDEGLTAVPLAVQDILYGVLLIKIPSQLSNHSRDLLDTLWRMANESAQVLRMTKLAEDMLNNQIDFDSLLDYSKKLD